MSEEEEALDKDELLKSVTQEALEKGQLQRIDKLRDGASYFNIMVCGASGIGKTCFVDMFLGQLDKEAYKTKFVNSFAEKKLQQKEQNPLNDGTSNFVTKSN